jgi:hypothetical protein
LRIQTSAERYLSGFVFCLSSTHSSAPSAYTLAYSTVLTIVNLDGTSILSLYSTELAAVISLLAKEEEEEEEQDDNDKFINIDAFDEGLIDLQL